MGRPRATAAWISIAPALALAATLGAGAPAAGAEPLRLTVGIVGPIGSIDPVDGTSAVAREVWQLQYSALTTFSLDPLRVVPGLAEAWTPTDDGRGFAYTLRAATWSDGRQVTATDVVTSLDRARDERWASAEGIVDDLRARAVDDRTVVITSTSAAGALPSLPLPIFPPGAARLDEAALSSGAWHVVRRTEDEVGMAVVDRPVRPALDEIVFRAYADPTALAGALDAGDVDIASGFSPDDYERVRSLDGVTAIHANDGDQWIMQVGVADPELRRAIALAIDRDDLVRSIVLDVGRSAAVPVVARPTEWQLDEAAARDLTDELAYAPDQARDLAAASAGRPPLTLTAPDTPNGDAIAESVIEALAEVGIAAEQVSAAPAELRIAERDPTDDPTPALSQYSCASGIWCDTTYDAAFAGYSAATDATTRRDAVHGMVRQIAETATEVVLFTPDRLQAFRTDNVTGMLREPDEVRLVAFWPSVQQYYEMAAARPPAAEEISTNAFIAIVVGVGLVVAVVVALIDRRVQAARR